VNYDPIKRSLGKVFNQSPFLRKLFYHLLDWLLLRTWHVKKEIRLWVKGSGEKKNACLLDAGSGFGQYSYFLSGLNKNWKVKGVDVKTEQIEDCNQFFGRIGRRNATFAYADLTQFGETAVYDFILSVDVMEHILEDVQVFTNFSRALKKGGMLLVSTPSDKGGSDVHEHEDGSFIGEHVRDGYNIDEIQQKLRKAGFLRTEAYYQYGCPGKISWKLSMKYPIQLLGITKLFFILLPFYYIITFPVSLVLNWFDVHGRHKTGTGLIVKAWM
jgi:2-polyprenyl-3-methyl-5-hydroxy-6-metoxy-1,4-benzoquinol methylase